MTWEGKTPLEVAQEFTQKWEGGLVDNPKDPGGITNWGISLRFLQDFADSSVNSQFLENEVGVTLPVTAQSIRDLTLAKAKMIMANEFWRRTGIYQLPPLIAVATYDAAVNCGAKRGVQFVQRAYNNVRKPPLDTDGVIGPNTLGCLSAADSIESALALLTVSERDEYYQTLVAQNKATYGDFLKGWLNRTADLRVLVRALEKEGWHGSQAAKPVAEEKKLTLWERFKRWLRKLFLGG